MIEALASHTNALLSNRAHCSCWRQYVDRSSSTSHEHLADTDETVMSMPWRCAKHGSALDKESQRVDQGEIGSMANRQKGYRCETSTENSVHLGYFVQQLLSSYANALAWYVDQQELNELANLCLDESCRGQAKAWASSETTDISFFYHTGRDGETDFCIGRDNSLSWDGLKRKLSQFPKQTVFTWNPQNEGEEDGRLFDQLESYLSDQGLKLIRVKHRISYQCNLLVHFQHGQTLPVESRPGRLSSSVSCLLSVSRAACVCVRCRRHNTSRSRSCPSP